MLTELQYQLLKRIAPGEPARMRDDSYEGKSKLRILLGDSLLDEVKGKTVVDFGCGEGFEAIELATTGCRKVIGVDIREALLERARSRAAAAGLTDRCVFTTQPLE